MANPNYHDILPTAKAGGLPARSVSNLRASIDLMIDHIGASSEASFSSLSDCLKEGKDRETLLTGWLAAMGLRKCDNGAQVGGSVLLLRHDDYLADNHFVLEMRTLGKIVEVGANSQPHRTMMIDWGFGGAIKCADFELLLVEALP